MHDKENRAAEAERTEAVWQAILRDLPVEKPRQKAWVWVRRIINIAAALIVLLTAAFPVAMANNEWFRSSVRRLVMQEEGNGVTVSLAADPAGSFPVPAAWEGLYFPSALPEGFRLCAVNDPVSLELTDGAGHLLIIEEHRPEDPAWIDTREKTLTRQALGERTACVIEGGGCCTVVVQTEERLLILSAAGLGRRALTDIAGSIRRVLPAP